MLILSIASGIAFSYEDFVEEGKNSGSVWSVIKGNWQHFFEDYRLIRPKKRGFITSSFTEEMEAKFSERFLKEYSCDVNMNELKVCLSNNYV